MNLPTPFSRQRGVSIFVVLVMVLLTTLLVLWASRSALLNEMVTGNDADYQRALEAAHAMVRDAEMDIQGVRADGTPCAIDATANCRVWGLFDEANNKSFYPESESEVQDMQATLTSKSPPCVAGICAPITAISASGDTPTTEFWTEKPRLDAMKAKAARYGDYTGAKAGTVGNPLLVKSADKAWYWVELLPYDLAAALRTGGTARSFAPDATSPYVYRITAVVKGMKEGTQAVVQSTVVWRRASS